MLFFEIQALCLAFKTAVLHCKQRTAVQSIYGKDVTLSHGVLLQVLLWSLQDNMETLLAGTVGTSTGKAGGKSPELAGEVKWREVTRACR
jgi:hypothetical protein